jgi:hypothetical protein
MNLASSAKVTISTNASLTNLQSCYNRYAQAAHERLYESEIRPPVHWYSPGSAWRLYRISRVGRNTHPGVAIPGYGDRECARGFCDRGRRTQSMGQQARQIGARELDSWHFSAYFRLAHPLSAYTMVSPCTTRTDGWGNHIRLSNEERLAAAAG